MGAYVEVPRAVEAGDFDLFEIAGNLRTGVVVQDVDTAVTVEDIGDAVGKGGVVGDIERNSLRLAAHGADGVDG
ncbi:hypothetical protein D3C87_2160270 [compost metagenome]